MAAVSRRIISFRFGICEYTLQTSGTPTQNKHHTMRKDIFQWMGVPEVKSVFLQSFISKMVEKKPLV